MKRLAYPLLGLLFSLLAACGGGGGGAAPPPPVVASTSGYPNDAASCSVAGQKSWLDDYMGDKYFWSAQRRVPNAAAVSIDAYFESQLFVPTDRYSATQELGAFTQFFVAGTRTGYGYSLAFADATQTKLMVRIVEPKGPAAGAGLQRGDTVVTINGLTAASIANGSLTAVTTAGITRTFSVENSMGVQRTLTMVSRNFPLSPVLTDTVLLAANGAKVGYLVYQDFTNLSLPPLGQAFDRFRTAGVTELVVDLRYNGGGSVQVARALASMIGGSRLNGKVFTKIRFNAQNQADDFDYPFTSTGLPAAPLEGLQRVVFITSPNTASASELVVNSLYPFFINKVVTIGTKTFGKPYGFQPRESCNTVFNAVNFETFNADNAGRFDAGLPATCTVADDLTKPLGDPTERRLAVALGYIQNDKCPATATTADLLLQAQSQSNAEFSGQTQARQGAVRRPAEPAFGEVSKPGMFTD